MIGRLFGRRTTRDGGRFVPRLDALDERALPGGMSGGVLKSHDGASSGVVQQFGGAAGGIADLCGGAPGGVADLCGGSPGGVLGD